MIPEWESQSQEMRAQLSNILVEAASGEGLVRVTVSADRQVRDILIDARHPDAADTEAVQDHLVLALNQALAKANLKEAEVMRDWMSRLMPSGLANLASIFNKGG